MESMTMSVRIRLSIMMFLQFMMFAVWWLPLASYLKETLGLTGMQIAQVASTMAIGCLVSPIIGMIADRHFASEKVLCVLNLACAVFLFMASRTTELTPLFTYLLLAMLCYMPTWGLTSAIAMANSPSEKFPQIRVFGSIGWVASGLFSLAAVEIFSVEGFELGNLPLQCGAAVSVVAGILALTIPTTPPPAKGQPASIVDALGLRAFSLLKDFNFAIFILITMLVMIPFSIYWTYCSIFLNDMGFKYIAVTMNWGQVAEMIFMLMIPLALARLGIKWSLAVGLVALLVRYVSFYFGGTMEQTWLYFVAIGVHGLIFGFFFVGGQIYIDKKAPKEIRAQAQGLIFLMSFGTGLLIGNFFNGKLIDYYSTKTMVATMVEGVEEMVEQTTYNWDMIWGITTVFSLVLLIAFIALFHDKLKDTEEQTA